MNPYNSKELMEKGRLGFMSTAKPRNEVITVGQILASKFEYIATDYAGKIHHRASCDQQCRKIQSQKTAMKNHKNDHDSSKQRTRLEPKPFSDALEVLSSDKDLFVEVLSEPDWCIKKEGRKSFSIGEIKKKLKHTFGGTRKEAHQFSMCGKPILSSSTNAKAKKQGLKFEKETHTTREKIDFSSGRLTTKYEVEAVLEANRLLSARLIDSNPVGTMSESPPRIYTVEHDVSPVGPRRDNQHWPGSAKIRLGSMRTNTKVTTSNKMASYDIALSSSMTRSTNEEAQDTMTTATGNTKIDDEQEIVEMISVRHSHAPNNMNNTARRTVGLESPKEDASVMHSTLDSVSDNETSINTVDDVLSTPTSIYTRLDMSERRKYQEEHESPVSVLDPFFSSPSTNMFHTARDPLKRRRLRFEECSLERTPQDYISRYVHLMIQAASLNWDKLSQTRPLPDQLLPSSLFDEVEFQLFDSCIDTRLVFDHINEVLSGIAQRYAAVRRRMCCVQPLKEVVVDEMMREGEFYLLNRAQQRTLDQLVAKDMADCRLWPDVWPETEHIMIQISEEVMEESILDIILEFYMYYDTV